MATGATVKMSVDVTQFKKGIQEATGEVKKLDAQLATNEKELKANGDAEVYMANKVGLLQKQLEAQKTVVANMSKALQEMKDKGVSPSSKEFQTMETNLAKAMGKMADIKTELNGVKTGASDAKTETKGMNTELKNIGKGVAFQNITEGLKEITSKLESGAKAAINFGKRLAKSAMDSTGWADDVLTRATQYGLDAETIQRMDNVSKFIDTDVDTIIAARGRLAKNSGKVEELFGLKTGGMSLEDQFWAVGEAIQGMTDDIEQEQAAQAVFGRGWKELVPMFAAGREEYEQLMNEQNVLTNEQVKKLGEADDQFQQMQIEIQRLKNEFWAENSDTIIDLLQWIIDNKDGVIGALTAIGGAFAALKVSELALNIKKVVDGFGSIKALGGGGGGGTTVGTGAGSGGSGAVSGVGGTASAAGGTGLLAKMGTGIKAIASAAAVPLAGIAGTAAWVFGISELVNTVNREAEAAREVEENVKRFSSVSGPLSDKRLVLQTAVRGIMSTDGLGAESQLKWLSYNLNKSILEAFSYDNGNKNKLMDMLGMDPQNAAVAYQMMKWAGYSVNDSRLTAEQQAAYQQGQASYMQMKDSGATLGYEWALGTVRDYFAKSGVFNENGEWTIPGLEEEMAAQQEAANAMNGAAEVMEGLPAAVAAAVEGANITVIVDAKEHANGLWNVPWDGYPAILHRGERVVPARDANNYTYNTYFGSVNLHNGLEIEALTESIDRRNRRPRSGYGS